MLLGVVQVRMESVAALIEKAGGLEEGDGFEYLDRALNHTSPATKARIAHGLVTGSRAVINEVIHIGTTNGQYRSPLTTTGGAPLAHTGGLPSLLERKHQ